MGEKLTSPRAWAQREALGKSTEKRTRHPSLYGSSARSAGRRLRPTGYNSGVMMNSEQSTMPYRAAPNGGRERGHAAAASATGHCSGSRRRQSAAWEAGILAGDVLTHINDVPTLDIVDYQFQIAGERVTARS